MDLFLSRATLELRRSRGFNALYISHQLVADMFGDRSDRGYLYRITEEGSHSARILVLSHDSPLTDIPARPWGCVHNIETRAYDVLFRPGQVVDFEVRINATRVVAEASGKKKRFDVWDAEFATNPATDRSPSQMYREYLQRHLHGAARLGDARVVGRGERTASRPGSKAVRFVASDCVGSLEIENPARFLEILAAGVGRARAFGCGLLCLSRPGSVLPRRHSGGAGEGEQRSDR